MPRLFRQLFLVLSLGAPLLLSVGCKKPESQPEAPITPEVQKEADDIWVARCATCHGATGVGNGPAGVALNPKPRNFTDKMWQSNVTDKGIDTIIVNGGLAVGKSPGMLANPDLASKPAVVRALRLHVR